MEEEGISDKLARTARRRVIWLALAAATATLLYLPFWRRERAPGDTAQLRITALEAYTERNAPRIAALREAMSGRLVPRPDLGRCAVDATAARKWTPERLDAFDPVKGNAFVEKVPAIDTEEELAAWKTKLAAWDRELDVVSETILREHLAHQGLPEERKPATRAYLYDYREKRIVCAGQIGAAAPDVRGGAAAPRKTRDAGALDPAPRPDGIVLFVADAPRG